MATDDFPITFREREVTQLLNALRAGESCAVVGMGSVGKSNLLRFLEREDVLRAHLDQEWQTFLLVYIDANKLLERSLWGLVELMLHQLLVALTTRQAGPEVVQALDDLHQRSTLRPTRKLALRYLDRVVGIVCGQLGLRLVFLMDEFDRLYPNLPARGLGALRALRDDHKYRLMYVIATRLELTGLRTDRARSEPFEELISPNMIWLGPYSEADAHFMLRRLETRYHTSIDDKLANDMLEAPGGHPGLLRAMYHAYIQHPVGMLPVLADSHQVQDECQRIWFSLMAEEQRVLLRLASGLTVDSTSGILERLRCKGMIGGPWANQDTIFSPLFAEYVKRQQPRAGVHIHLDRERHRVLVDGCVVEGLARLEYKFIEYLEERRGQMCSRDDLARHLYPKDMELDGKGVSDARLDAIVKRLRKRIESVSGQQRYIETIRGVGFRLMDGDEDAM